MAKKKEKAHTDLHNLLLQAMDNGFITTSRGKKISFRNCVIAMTTNAAANLAERESVLGFEKISKGRYSHNRLHTELKKYFSMEFLGRVNEILYFEKLDSASVKEIISKRLQSVTGLLLQKNITATIDASAIDYIYEKSDCHLYGARNIHTVVAKEVETLVSEMILSGVLKSGSSVCITAEKGQIDVKILQTI